MAAHGLSYERHRGTIIPDWGGHHCTPTRRKNSDCVAISMYLSVPFPRVNVPTAVDVDIPPTRDAWTLMTRAPLAMNMEKEPGTAGSSASGPRNH